MSSAPGRWTAPVRRIFSPAGQARDTGFFERMFRIAAAAEKAIKAVYQRHGAALPSGQPASVRSHAASTACIPRRKPADYFAGMMQSVAWKEFFNSVRVFWPGTELVRQRLQAAVERFVEDENILRATLSSSFAGGRAVFGSDLEILARD